MHRRTLIAWMGTLPLLTVSNNFAQVNDLNDAINKAGRQRMLSQRVAKAYLAVGQTIAVPRAQSVLATSMALFDRQLVELKSFSPNADIRGTYGQLEAVWGEYKTLLVGQAPKRENAGALIELDSKVLALAQQGTMQLEQASGRAAGRLVNVAGRQRLLSERVAKYYLVLAWKAPVSNAQAELDRARAEFAVALDVLAKAPESSAQIRQEIELARQQWVFFDAALAQRGADPAARERSANVFASSENLLTVMDKVTGLYTELSA